MKLIWESLKFCWTYSERIESGALIKIWLSKAYSDIYPLISAYFLKIIIDYAIAVSQHTKIINYVEILTIFSTWFIADILSQFFYRYQTMQVKIMQRKISVNVEVDLAYLHSNLPIEFIEDANFRDHFSLVKRESSFRVFTIVANIVDFFSGIIGFILAGLIVINFGVWYLGALLFVSLFRLMIVNKSIKKTLIAAENDAKLSRHWEIYESYLESIKTSYESRILGIQNITKRRLSSIMEKTIEVYAGVEKSLLWQRVVLAVLPMAGIFLISADMLFKVLKGNATIGEWQFVFNSGLQLSERFNRLVDSYSVTKESGIFVKKLIDILNKAEDLKVEKGEKYNINSIESIVFDNVSFKYKNTENYALKNISLKINKNENVAIVGLNGAGKTTLVKLLCNFYQPTEGKILINGIDISIFNKISYWQSISALFQDFERYPISAKESIGFGDVSRLENTEEIKKAANLIGIEDYINSLPEGFDTPLVRDLKGGVDLSTGQWQKIALARALFRKSQIIILDEPTSNIDPQSEEEIFDKLTTIVNNRVMLLISHRFSTVKKADRIFVIDKGRLIEEGSHSELMSKYGKYAKLFNIQAKSYIPTQ